MRFDGGPIVADPFAMAEWSPAVGGWRHKPLFFVAAALGCGRLFVLFSARTSGW